MTANHKVVLSDTVFAPSSFTVVDSSVPKPGADQVLVKTIYLGLNAGMRSRIAAHRDGQGTIQVGDTPTSDAILQVLESDSASLPAGSMVFRQWHPWEEYSVVPVSDLTLLPAGDPLWFATILGHTGFTAWTSLRLANVSAGDHVLVSAAAGGVGSAAVQFALALGAKVTGIASASRLGFVEQLGATALDRNRLEAGQLALPSFNVFHDAVGGRLLELAIDGIDVGGRIVLCGALSGETPGNYRRMIHKEITMRGFTVMNHLSFRPEFWDYGCKWLAEQKIKPIYQIHDGLDSMGEAFCGMFNTVHGGRQIVRV